MNLPLGNRVWAGSGRAGRAGSGRGRGAGFTLIETAMATVIIGVGVVAMVDAQEAFTRSTLWSSHSTTGTFLANEIREMARHMARHDPVNGLWLEGETLNGWGPESGEASVDGFDDLDDLDGLVFGEGGDFGGPINAYGEVIPEIGLDGQVIMDEDGRPVPMFGWTQEILVEKVSPFDYATTLVSEFFEAPSGGWAGREVGGYPLRVTVVVRYQSAVAIEPIEVARVSWVVPE